MGARLTRAVTATLLKTAHLEVIRQGLPEWTQTPPPQVPGETTVRRLEGRAAFTALGRIQELGARQMLFVPGGGQLAGFLHDAQKEYAEARTTLALVSGGTIPTPQSLGVEYPAYLNGIAEAVGELRRMLLDRLRRGEYDGCEAILGAMDDIYSVLVTIDFPDAMTGGLRRTTDQTRGILERTRGDLTMAIVQHGAAAAAGESTSSGISAPAQRRTAATPASPGIPPGAEPKDEQEPPPMF